MALEGVEVEDGEEEGMVEVWRVVAIVVLEAAIIAVVEVVVEDSAVDDAATEADGVVEVVVELAAPVPRLEHDDPKSGMLLNVSATPPLIETSNFVSWF